MSSITSSDGRLRASRINPYATYIGLQTKQVSINYPVESNRRNEALAFICLSQFPASLPLPIVTTSARCFRNRSSRMSISRPRIPKIESQAIVLFFQFHLSVFRAPASKVSRVVTAMHARISKGDTKRREIRCKMENIELTQRSRRRCCCQRSWRRPCRRILFARR